MGNMRVVALCFFVALGPAIFGLESSELAGFQAMKSFVADFGEFSNALKRYTLPAVVQLWLSAMFNMGAILGSLISGPIGRRWGRRIGFGLTAIAVIAGVVIQIVGTVNPVLYFGRVIAGMGVGGISNFVPMYQAELAPARLRGILTASYQFLVCFGQLMGACVCFGTFEMPTRMAYRIPLITQLLFPTLLGLGVFMIPESPRWLLTKDRHDDAFKSLQKVRPKQTSTDDLVAELEREKRFIRVDHATLNLEQYKECFRGTNLARTHIACGVMVWSILSGISFISGYGTYFFSVSGVTNSFQTQMILATCGLAGLFVNFAIVRHVGRRPMLVWGGLCQGIFMFVFAVVGTILPTNSKVTSNVLVTFVCLYGFCYNMTWGPVGWMVLPEVVSTNVRSSTLAMATGLHWGANLLVTCGVPYLINPEALNLGPKTGFVFGSLNILIFIWTWVFLPETKDRTLEQVDEMFIKRVPVRQFRTFKCTGDTNTGDSLGKPEGEIETVLDLKSDSVHVEEVRVSHSN